LVLVLSFIYLVASQIPNIVQDTSINPTWIALLMGYFVVFFITITSLSFLVNKLEGSNLALQEKNNTTQNTLDIALDAARKFELFSNSATDIFWITDLDLNYSYISPSIENFLVFQ
jgi:hypothetical protein